MNLVAMLIALPAVVFLHANTIPRGRSARARLAMHGALVTLTVIVLRSFSS